MNFEEDWYPEDEGCFRCGGMDTDHRDMLGYRWHPECLEERKNETSAISKMWRMIRGNVDRT